MSLRTRVAGVLLLLLSTFAVKGQSIYKTPSGAKYHLANCRMIKNVSEKITPEQAVKLGLEPCKICKPVIVAPQPVMSDKAAGTADKTVQCNGITKAGTRCKHMTRIANGFCAQHQPEK